MKEKKNAWTHCRDFFRDFGFVLLETVFLLISTLAPWFFELNVFSSSVSDPGKAVWIALARNGKLPLAVGLFVFWLFAIRKLNKDEVLNLSGAYHDYIRPFYWWAAFLGYKKCNPVLVPIHLQIYLVMNHVFEAFPIQEEYQEVKNDNVKVTLPNMLEVSESEAKTKAVEAMNNGKPINLILEDTYIINDDLSQLPENVRDLCTIKISRCTVNGVHRFSPDFIDKVTEFVSSLPDGAKLNLFATVNPVNLEQITRKAFSKGGRGNLMILRVYQQSRSGKREFINFVEFKGENAS